jgi:hypothetical protein
MNGEKSAPGQQDRQGKDTPPPGAKAVQSPDDQAGGGHGQSVLECLPEGKNPLLRRTGPEEAEEQQEGAKERRSGFGF